MPRGRGARYRLITEDLNNRRSKLKDGEDRSSSDELKNKQREQMARGAVHCRIGAARCSLSSNNEQDQQVRLVSKLRD